jgi:hypothetical protein
MPCLLPAALVLPLVLSSEPQAASRTTTAAEECRACADTGLSPCKKCLRRACGGEVQALFCSAAIECEECFGYRSIPCSKCDRGPSPEREGQLDANRAWLAEQREIDSFMGAGILHVESEHFRLTYDLERIDVKGGETPHGGLHIFLDRLETLYERFVEDLSADPSKDFFGKTHVMLWRDARSQEQASARYTLQPSSTQSKLMGASPIVSIHYDKSHLHEESELHQAVVHQVAHCLLSNVFDGIWPGNIRGGWIDAGLAHHYEVSLFGSVRHYCYVESDTMRSFKSGQWEPAVRKAVDAGRALPFLQVTGKHTTELTPEQHMFSWSFVDYVLRRHPGHFGTLARAIKARKSVSDALLEALGISPFEFDADWQEYVRTEYSLKPRRR